MGICFSDENVYVGEGTLVADLFRAQTADTLITVLAIYSKEAGAGSKHAWRPVANSIGAISYLVFQVYEAPAPNRTNSFRSSLNSHVVTRADRAFLLVPATQFLFRLQDPPSLVMPGNSFYPRTIGLHSGRWPVHHHFARI